MKKLFTLALIALTLLSCSSDDDNERPKSPEDILVEKSPWIFQRLEVVEIDENGTPETTVAQAEAYLKSSNRHTAVAFNSDNTGYRMDADDERFNYTYEYDKENDVISFAENVSDLNSVTISENQFTYVLYVLIDNGEGSEDNAIAKTKFYYKPAE